MKIPRFFHSHISYCWKEEVVENKSDLPETAIFIHTTLHTGTAYIFKLLSSAQPKWSDTLDQGAEKIWMIHNKAMEICTVVTPHGL